jgi:hypothetical protein
MLPQQPTRYQALKRTSAQAVVPTPAGNSRMELGAGTFTSWPPSEQVPGERTKATGAKGNHEVTSRYVALTPPQGPRASRNSLEPRLVWLCRFTLRDSCRPVGPILGRWYKDRTHTQGWVVVLKLTLIAVAFPHIVRRSSTSTPLLLFLVHTQGFIH